MSRRLYDNAVHIGSRHKNRRTHVIHVRNHEAATRLEFFYVTVDFFGYRQVATITREVKHHKPCRRIEQ